VIFEQPIARYAVSGTLIALYGIVDHAARRGGGDPLRARVRSPRWLAPLIFASLLAFYATIRPFGGDWLGGWGNLAGIVLAGVAMATRHATRHGVMRVRQPDVVARLLFYAALPVATGVASGFLTLTLPAVIASAWCSVREDRLLAGVHGAAWSARVASSARWVPGIW
jgi:hypothetical protein